MPVVFDFKCTKCGNLERDIMLKDSKQEAPDCKICGEKMEKQFTGFSTKASTKTERQLPSNYQLSQGGANFGRMSDL